MQAPQPLAPLIPADQPEKDQGVQTPSGSVIRVAPPGEGALLTNGWPLAVSAALLAAGSVISIVEIYSLLSLVGVALILAGIYGVLHRIQRDHAAPRALAQ